MKMLAGSEAMANTGYPQTQLPPDYIDLEKRVDALKAVHQKMLAVTWVYLFPLGSISHTPTSLR